LVTQFTEAYQGHQHPQQRQQHHAGGEGDAFRVQRGDGLRGDLGEDQDHQRQQEGGDDDARVAVETDRDDRGDRRGGDVDEVVADQDQADQPVRALEQRWRAGRRGVVACAGVSGGSGSATSCRSRSWRKTGHEDQGREYRK
jgi:hypothetical protein